MTYRIKLKRGYQRKLIKLAKTKFTWDKLGKILEVSPSYLRLDLLNEKRLISEKVYSKLCKLSYVNYDFYILQKFPKNWGQAKGGRISKTKEKENKNLIKNYSEELAEFMGIMLGDGNMWEKKGHYYIRIAGHSEDDRDYLLKHVRTLIKNLFDLEVSTYKHKTNNEFFLTKGSKDLVYTLKKLGLKSGNKIKNKNRIPKWVFSSKKYLKSCIRGLIDTDGSVLPITGRKYTYIWFTCANPCLREDFSKAMQILGYRIAKWNFNGTPETYIGSKELIRKYYKEIGFNNSKHIKRFMMLR